MAWQSFLRALAIKVPLHKTFLITWIGAFVDLLVPAESISGDLTKAYLMTKDSTENPGRVVASVLGHRILSMVIPLVSLSFSFTVLTLSDVEVPVAVSALSLLVILGTAASLFFLFLFSLKEQIAQRFIGAALRFLGFVFRGRLDSEKIRNGAVRTLGSFHDAINAFRSNPASLVAATLFSLVSWILSILISFIVFVSLGQHVDLVTITVVHSISVTIQSVPLGIPGEVGVVDTAMTWLYGLLAVEFTVGAAATVLIQFLRVWLRIAIGFAAVHHIGLKKLAEMLRQDLHSISSKNSEFRDF